MSEQTGTAPETPAIYAAMHRLMEQVTNIPKAGTANFGEKYSFRRVEDTIQLVGQAARTCKIMLQAGIVDAPQVLRNEVPKFDRSGNPNGATTWTSVHLVVRYSFTSLEDGSSLDFEAAGEGRDNSDKATAKAMSNALKYCLGQALLIGTGDAEPDQERPTMETPAANTGQGGPSQAATATQRRPAAQPPVSAEQPADSEAGRAEQALRAARNTPDMGEFSAVWNQAQDEKLLNVVPVGEEVSLKSLLMAERRIRQQQGQQ